MRTFILAFAALLAVTNTSMAAKRGSGVPAPKYGTKTFDQCQLEVRKKIGRFPRRGDGLEMRKCLARR